MAETEVNTGTESVHLFVQKVKTWVEDLSQSVNYQTHIKLGDEICKLSFIGWESEPIHLKAIAHLVVENSALEAKWYLVNRSKILDPLPEPCWNWSEIAPSGKIPGFEKAGYLAFYQSEGDAFILIDPQNNWAFWTCANAAHLPEWELAAPFRLLFQHWLKLKNYFLVHAGAVAIGNKAALFAGAGGAGKSTTSLACLNAGFQYLGDDFVAIEPNLLLVQSISTAAKVNSEILDQLPGLQPHFSTKILEKECMFTIEAIPDQVLINSSLSAIIVVGRNSGNTTSRYQKIDSVTAFKALMPSTIALLHDGNETIAVISELVKKMPCFLLFAGTDLNLVAETVREIISNRNA